jgi:hypothetical protein
MSSLQVGEHLTRALVECFEEYDVEIAEEGPMGMRMTRELETSSVTGAHCCRNAVSCYADVTHTFSHTHRHDN